MQIKCRCGYEWDTRSKLKSVSCPNCASKVKLPKTPTEKLESPPVETKELPSQNGNTKTEPEPEQRPKVTLTPID